MVVQATEAETNSDTISTDGPSVDHLFRLLKEKLQEDSLSIQYVAGWAQTRSLVLRKWIRLRSSITTEVATSAVDMNGEADKKIWNCRSPQCYICESPEHLKFDCSFRNHCHMFLQLVHIVKYCEALTPVRRRHRDSLRH